MKKESLEIGNAVYTGVCIYNRLRKSIVQIDDKFVSLEDKVDLGLYLGVLHSKNSISILLNDTELKSRTKLDYKKLDSKEFCELYDLYFKNIVANINRDSLNDYFKELLSKNIVIELNKEYNINPIEFIDVKNKQLIKK